MTFWEITRKDLILLVRDPRALALLVAFPLLFIMIIGATTGQLLGWKDENQILKVGILDLVNYSAISSESERAQAQTMTAKIINRIGDARGRRIRLLDTDDEIQSLLEDDELDVVFVIGSEFFDRVQEMEPENVASTSSGPPDERLRAFDMSLRSELPEDSATRSTITELLLYNTIEVTAPYVFCSKIRTSNISVNAEIQRRLNCKSLYNERVSIRPPGERETATSSSDNRVYQELIPSYTVMFVFFLVNIMARSFLHERELGTLRRLRLAPVSAASLVAGKTLPFLVISLVQSVLLFLCGKILFGMSWGNSPAMLLPVIFCTSAAATGLGLVVATLVRSESQVSAYANIVVITMAGISGCFMPRDWLPNTLRTASLATPHAWSLISYEQLLKRDVADLATVWTNCGVLLLFTGAFFAIGCARFRRVE